MVTPIAAELLETTPKRALPKIPFGHLVERGLVKPGDRLFDAKKRFSALVRADGSLLAADRKTGSIHGLGAALRGSSCNGWQFWHVERDGEPVLIDQLRDQIRAELATKTDKGRC